MKPIELEKRLAALESTRTALPLLVMELPPRRYEPAYPATPVRRLFKEILDTRE